MAFVNVFAHLPVSSREPRKIAHVEGFGLAVVVAFVDEREARRLGKNKWPVVAHRQDVRFPFADLPDLRQDVLRRVLGRTCELDDHIVLRHATRAGTCH